jgi:hypothetical protein
VGTRGTTRGQQTVRPVLLPPPFPLRHHHPLYRRVRLVLSWDHDLVLRVACGHRVRAVKRPRELSSPMLEPDYAKYSWPLAMSDVRVVALAVLRTLRDDARLPLQEIIQRLRDDVNGGQGNSRRRRAKKQCTMSAPGAVAASSIVSLRAGPEAAAAAAVGAEAQGPAVAAGGVAPLVRARDDEESTAVAAVARTQEGGGGGGGGGDDDGESFLRVHWVAVPKATRARRVNRRRRRRCSPRC